MRKKIFLSTKTTGLIANAQIYEICTINSYGEILHHAWRPPFMDLQGMTKQIAIQKGYFTEGSKVAWEHLQSLPTFNPQIVTEYQNFVDNSVVYHYAFAAFFMRFVAPIKIQTVDLHEVCKFKFSLNNYKFETILNHLGIAIGDRSAQLDAVKLHEIHELL